MKERFVSTAGEDGEIFTRKVNDNPEPGKGLEWGWLQALPIETERFRQAETESHNVPSTVTLKLAYAPDSQ